MFNKNLFLFAISNCICWKNGLENCQFSYCNFCINRNLKKHFWKKIKGRAKKFSRCCLSQYIIVFHIQGQISVKLGDLACWEDTSALWNGTHKPVKVWYAPQRAYNERTWALSSPSPWWRGSNMSLKLDFKIR
jgi:hypothetical protein